MAVIELINQVIYPGSMGIIKTLYDKQAMEMLFTIHKNEFGSKDLRTDCIYHRKRVVQELFEKYGTN